MLSLTTNAEERHLPWHSCNAGSKQIDFRFVFTDINRSAISQHHSLSNLDKSKAIRQQLFCETLYRLVET